MTSPPALPRRNSAADFGEVKSALATLARRTSSRGSRGRAGQLLGIVSCLSAMLSACAVLSFIRGLRMESNANQLVDQVPAPSARDGGEAEKPWCTPHQQRALPDY